MGTVKLQAGRGALPTVWAGLLAVLAVANAAAQPNLLVVGPSALEFAAPDAANPSNQAGRQTVFVASSGDPLSYQAKTGYWSSDTGWLSVTPASGTTPSTLTVSADAANLAKGVYFGYLEITSGTASPAVLQVTLRVGSPAAVNAGLASSTNSVNGADEAQLVAEPRALTFKLAPGESTPSAQTITIGSTSKILNYTASTDSGSWLALGPQLGTTSDGSNTVFVAVNPANLPEGIQTGFISVTAPGAAGALTIPVTTIPFKISTGGPNAASGVNAALSVDRSSITLQGPLKGPAQTQTIRIASTVNEPYIASGLGSVWLSVAPSTGSTPATLVVTADPTFLSSVGTYTSYLQIYSPGNSDLQYVQVVYNVTAGGGGGNAITASPSSISFAQTLGGATPASQTVQLNSTTATSFTAASTATWLTVTPTSGTTPTTLTFSVNAAGLAAGTYQGSVTVTGGGTTVSIPVTLTISSSSGNGITATPSSVSFSQTLGGATPASQTVQLSGATATSFTAASTATWLTVNPTSGTTPATLTLSVNTAGLAAATYQGSVTVTGGGTSFSIPVTLTIGSSGNSGITATPSSISFAQTLGGATPASQTVQLSGTTVTSFTAASTATWLSVTPTSGTTPATLTLSVNTAGLVAGAYQGSITVTGTSGGGTTVSIPVSLTISSSGTITAAPPSVSFAQTLGGTVPSPQTVQLSSSATATSFTAASTATWLTVTPTSGTAPTTLTLSVNATGLAAGTYQGSINVTGGATSVSVPVTLTVLAGSSSVITASPIAVAFSLIAGQNAFSLQNIQLSAASPTSFIVSNSAPWLTVTPLAETTPATLTLSANSAGLAPGTYQTSLTITGGVTVISIPVMLTVSVAPNSIAVAPTSISFTQIAAGNAPAAQTIQLSSPSPTNFTAAGMSTWLTVAPAAGTTPATLTVTVNPAGLAAGTYQDTITISGGATPVTVPVSLTLSGDALVSTPASLSFKQTVGATTPASQTLQLTSSIPRNYIASSTAEWLSAAPAIGITPATLTVTVNSAQLALGTYTGSITVNGVGPPLSIPVTLTVASGTGAIFSPATLAFSFSPGGQTPPTQTVAVSSPGSDFSFAASATASNGGTWLAVSPATDKTPATLTVAVTPAGLATGKYSGIITVTPTDSAIPAQSLPVTLSVGSGSTALFFVRSILNAASFLPGPLAPGEIITVTGTGLGPTVGAGPNLLASGSVDTQVAGTRVLFDGIPAPLLFVRSDQINAIVPYNVYGRTGTNMQIEVSGVRSDPISLRVENTAPALFSIDGSGRGQAAIVNQDGTINSPAAAAASGSIVSIYGTGEGQTSPPGQAGRIITTDLRTPLAPVSVKIGGVPAEVRYIGSAPGQVSGLFQLNVLVPTGLIPNPQLSVEVLIGGVLSQFGTTMAVK